MKVIIPHTHTHTHTQDKQDVNIGIDLGPTSIGIAIVNNDGKVVEKPIIFRCSDACSEKDGSPNNASRREFRCSRRRIQRKITLKRDFKVLLLKYFPKLISNTENKFEKIDSIIFNEKDTLTLKIKGLNQQLTLEELISVLFNYLKHRGTFNIKSNPIKEFPSELLKKHFDKNGYIRGNVYSNDGKIINESLYFSNDEWKKEIEQLLSKQNIDNSFKNQYLNLFTRKRDYRFGPCNKKTYEYWKDKMYYGVKLDEDGEPMETLWDKTIGKCGIYPNEPRALKKTTSFELFNLMEQLNNSKYVTEDTGEVKPINKKIKLLLLNDCISNNESPSEAKLKKAIIKFEKENNAIDYKKTEISLLPTNGKTGKFLYKFNQLEHTLFFSDKLNLNVFADNSFKWSSICSLNDLANKISRELTDDNFEEVNEKKKLTKKPKIESINFEDNETNEYLSKHYKQYSGTTKLSLKALDISIPLLFDSDTSENLSNLIRNSIFKKELSKKNIGDVLKNIGSPSVKKIIEYFIKISHDLMKHVLYKYNISSINIELTRERNSKEIREQISEGQKWFEEKHRQLEKKYQLGNDRGFMKYFLWDRQDRLDPYSGKEIMINDIRDCEIDHIYGYSWSYDDSLKNKVITFRYQNQRKGNMTVAEWLGQKKQRELFEKVWSNWLNKPEMKNVVNRLNDPRINHSDIAKEFIGRNLSDTSWISLEIKNLIVDHCLFGKDVKVNTVSGKFTKYLRNKFGKYDKDRDKFVHHGIDAIAIAYASFLPQRLQSWLVRNGVDDNFDDDTLNNKNIEDIKTKIGKNEINEYIQNINNFAFAKPVIKKRSKAFLDQNYYGVYTDENGKRYYLKKENVFDIDNKKIKKYFLEDKENNFLYKKDKVLFNCLKHIVEKSNDGSTNIFKQYMRDFHHEEDPHFLFLSKKDFQKFNLDRDVNIRFLRILTRLEDDGSKYINKKINAYQINSEWNKLMFYLQDEKVALVRSDISNTKHICKEILTKEKNKKQNIWIKALNYNQIFDCLTKKWNFIDEPTMSSKDKCIKYLKNFKNKYGFGFLYKGDKFKNISNVVDGKQEFLISGIDISLCEISGWNGKMLEIKDLHENHHDKSRLFVSIPNFLKFFKKVNIDKLGKIYENIAKE